MTSTLLLSGLFASGTGALFALLLARPLFHGQAGR